MDVRERLALNMKRLRKERGWSQEALADEAGLDRTYISGIERVVKNPTVSVIERIALALKCPLGMTKARSIGIKETSLFGHRYQSDGLGT